jgi:hypothetical protein
MAGSVDITGRQYYTFGIGHESAQPVSSVGNESSAVALQTVNGVQSLVNGDGKSLPLTLTQQYERWMEFITVASTTPWNDQAGAGLTIAVDSAVLFNGQPTLRLDIPASSSGTYRVGTTLATLNMPYLWDGKQLAVAVKSSNMTACDGVTGVLLGDASFTNFYTFTGQRNAANVPQANWVAGDWIISRGTVATQTASGTFVGQKRLRINFTISSVGTATQIWIGFVGAAASKKPTVILSIDDGYASGYSFVAPLARYYKIPVSFGIDRAYVGSGNYFTAAQIRELHADPSNLFEFVTHGNDNKTINDLGVAEYVSQNVRTRDYLRGLGIMGDGPNHHPWVQSLYSNAAQDAMKAAGFLSARMGASTPLSMHDSFMSTGDEKRVYQLVNCCTLTTGLSLGQAQTAVTTACTTEGYGVTHVNAHDFAVADAASPPTWSFDKMTEFMGWLDAQRTAGVCDIKSWGQWYADLAGVPYGK